MRPFLATLSAMAMVAGGAAVAAPVLTGISTTVPPGTEDATSPYTDDVLLNSLTYQSGDGARTATYDATIGSFSTARTFTVLSGRENINAEYGDDDTAADGDPDPFTKAGFAGANQETTNPVIQDAALLNAFNSRSLSEITDGEGAGSFSFLTTFTKSLAFGGATGVGGDDLPDIVFFERGGNDVFQVELIVGGTLRNPIFSNALTIDSGDFASTGFQIDTLEIGGGQTMTVGGFDLSAFGLVDGDIVSGFRLSAGNGSGPDLGGFFLAAEDPDVFLPPLAAVPLPASALLLLGGLGALGAARRRA